MPLRSANLFENETTSLAKKESPAPRRAIPARLASVGLAPMGLASAAQSLLAGIGAAVGTVHRVSRFGIEAYDDDGERLGEGGEQGWRVSIRGPAKSRARVTDYDNGRYAFEWVPSTSGQYEIAITLRGQLVSGTPFVFTVLEPMPFAPNCSVSGGALTMAHAREPQCFEVTFRDQLNQLAPAVDLEVFVELVQQLSPRSPRIRPSRSPSPTRPPSPPKSPPPPPTIVTSRDSISPRSLMPPRSVKLHKNLLTRSLRTPTTPPLTKSSHPPARSPPKAPASAKLQSCNHHKHVELWKSRETLDRLQSSGRLAIDRHRDPRVFLQELDVDPTGFAFGGVRPGGRCLAKNDNGAHSCHYSVGRAGVYLLHVNLRKHRRCPSARLPASCSSVSSNPLTADRESEPLPGSPFKLHVLPGLHASASTSFLTTGGDSASGACKLARGTAGRDADAGCHVTLRSCDEMGNRCINGGAKVVCTCALAPQLIATCADDGNGAYQITVTAPARVEDAIYALDVTLDGVAVMGSPLKLLFEGTPAGSAFSDHLWLGITIDGMREFLQEELHFPILGWRGLTNLDGYETSYVRDEAALGWVSAEFGPAHPGKLTGYDLCAAISEWMRSIEQEDKSLCEVLTFHPRWRQHVGRAGAFYSHPHGRSIRHTLECLERGCDLYADKLPSDEATNETYFWIDYFTLPQCRRAGLDPLIADALIKEIGFTMIELSTQPQLCLGRSACLFECAASLPPPRLLPPPPAEEKEEGKRKARLVDPTGPSDAQKSQRRSSDASRTAQAPRLSNRRRSSSSVTIAAPASTPTAPPANSSATPCSAEEVLERLKRGETRSPDLVAVASPLPKPKPKVYCAIDLVRASLLRQLLLDHQKGTGPFAESQDRFKRVKPPPPPMDCAKARALDPQTKEEVDARLITEMGFSPIDRHLSTALQQSLAELLESSKSAENLNLNQCELTVEHAEPLAKLVRVSSAATLGLADNDLGTKGVDLLCTALARKEELPPPPPPEDSAWNKAGEGMGWDEICALQEAADAAPDVSVEKPLSLTRLDLSGNRLGECCGSTFDTLLQTLHLTTLCLDDNDLRDEGARSLAVALVEQATCVNFLSLRRNGICTIGLLTLASMLEVNGTLTMLHLDENEFGTSSGAIEAAEGPVALAFALRRNRTLTSLSLEGSALGDDGLRVIGEALLESSVSRLTFGRFDDFELTHDQSSLQIGQDRLLDGSATLLASLLVRNMALTSLDMLGVAISDASIGIIGEALLRSKFSQLAFLRCSLFDCSEGVHKLTLNSRHATFNDIVLLSAVLKRNRQLNTMIVDHFKLASSQLLGVVPMDARAPWAAHAILGLAHPLSKAKLRAPAFTLLAGDGAAGVSQSRFFGELLTSSPFSLQRTRELWNVLEKDARSGDVSLGSFAKGVATYTQLSFVTATLNRRQDPLLGFLVFRWKNVHVPELSFDIPAQMTGRLRVRGMYVGTIVAASAPTLFGNAHWAGKAKQRGLAERIRFNKPLNWLRAVDFWPDGVMKSAGQADATIDVLCSVASTSFTFRVEVREWSYDLVGARLLIQHGDPQRPPCCTTVMKYNVASGSVVCTVDNAEDSRTLDVKLPAVAPLETCANWLRTCELVEPRIVDASIQAARPAKLSAKHVGRIAVCVELDGPQRMCYSPGHQLLLLLWHDHYGSIVVDATVVEGPGGDRPTRHALHVEFAGASEEGTISMDLNEFNHCTRRFETAAAFVSERETFAAYLGARCIEASSDVDMLLNCLAAEPCYDTVSRSADAVFIMHDAWARTAPAGHDALDTGTPRDPLQA